MQEQNELHKSKMLLKKYIEGLCTAEEEKRVLLWFYTMNDQNQDEAYPNMDGLANKINQNLSQQIQFTAKNSSISFKRTYSYLLAIACSLILIGIIAILFFFQYLDLDQGEIAANGLIPISGSYGLNDVEPGINVARLKLNSDEEYTLKNQDFYIVDHQNNISSKDKITLEVPKAGKFKIILSDGTKVWMNAGSRLVYPEKFIDKNREVSLEGEAYFEVCKDANRPFLISCKDIKVEVLGTSFNVSSYAGSFTTSLVEGSVKVIKDNQVEYLSPGQITRLIDNKLEISKSDIQSEIAWKRGEFNFDMKHLDEIIQEIGRWYDVTFVYNTDQVQSKVFSGTISRNSNLSKVLAILEASTGMKFTIKNRTIVVN